MRRVSHDELSSRIGRITRISRISADCGSFLNRSGSQARVSPFQFFPRIREIR